MSALWGDIDVYFYILMNMSNWQNLICIPNYKNKTQLKKTAQMTLIQDHGFRTKNKTLLKVEVGPK